MSVIGRSRKSGHPQASTCSVDRLRAGTSLAQLRDMLLTLSVRSTILALAFALVSSVALAAEADPATPGGLTLTAAVTAPADNEQSSLNVTATNAPATQVAKPNATTLRYSLYASFATLQALDAHSTLRAINGGGSEANPFMAGIASKPFAFVAMKAGTTAATIYLAEKLSKKNPIASVLLMTAMNSAYATVVAHNYRLATAAR